MKHPIIVLVMKNRRKTMLEVVETFVSINGEGQKAGQLACFIRMKGCNLNCTYCDTKWANQENTPFQYKTKEELYDWVKSTVITDVNYLSIQCFLITSFPSLSAAVSVRADSVC